MHPGQRALCGSPLTGSWWTAWQNRHSGVTLEENVLQGGYGLPVTAYIHEHYPHRQGVEYRHTRRLRWSTETCPCCGGAWNIDSDSIIKTMKSRGDIWLGRD